MSQLKTHDATAPWKNYLVVLEGNVEEKKSKATTQEKKSAAKKGSKSNVTSLAAAVPPESGAITLVNHDHLGMITAIQTEMMSRDQAVTSDGGSGGITLEGPFAIPVEANCSESTHSLPVDTPNMSSLLEEAASHTILAHEAEAAQVNILTVVVSDKMCKDDQIRQRASEMKGDDGQANPENV